MRRRAVVLPAAAIAGGILAVGVILLAGSQSTGLPAVERVIPAGLSFQRQYHIPYQSISDPDDLLAVRFGAGAPTATPSTFIFDARGRIAWAYFGAITYSQLEAAMAGIAVP
jgi:hypothetical protein